MRGVRKRPFRAAPGRAAFKRKVRQRQIRRTQTKLSVGELKFHDLDIDDGSITQAGTIAEDSCVTIAQGTTESERLGRKITIRSINWRWDIVKIASTSPSNGDEVVRVILYLDKQTNGATATTVGLLETDDYQSFNNLANKSRFRILMDRTYVLNALSGGGDGTVNDLYSMIISDSLYKKVSIPIEYDNSLTTGVITTVRSNNIGVLLLSKTGAISQFASKMRLRFSDV